MPLDSNNLPVQIQQLELFPLAAVTKPIPNDPTTLNPIKRRAIRERLANERQAAYDARCAEQAYVLNTKGIRHHDRVSDVRAVPTTITLSI